ncbi:hypothetical protein [Streptomyces sp. CAU 1734]|uniref:hypothetical protein n=1 Tax=Streptomyces sp. CAU 1734 TaxID=3140360 RepID=UPI0032604E7B
MPRAGRRQECRAPAASRGSVKFLGVRTWVVVLIALFGFWLSDTFLAPAIHSGTESGVSVTNGTHD